MRTREMSTEQVEIVEFYWRTGFPISYEYYYLDAEWRNRLVYFESDESGTAEPLILNALFYKCDSVKIEYLNIDGTRINEVEASGYAWSSGTHMPSLPRFLRCEWASS